MTLLQEHLVTVEKESFKNASISSAGIGGSWEILKGIQFAVIDHSRKCA